MSCACAAVADGPSCLSATCVPLPGLLLPPPRGVELRLAIPDVCACATCLVRPATSARLLLPLPPHPTSIASRVYVFEAPNLTSAPHLILVGRPYYNDFTSCDMREPLSTMTLPTCADSGFSDPLTGGPVDDTAEEPIVARSRPVFHIRDLSGARIDFNI